MTNIISESFANYLNTRTNFEAFHNNVINMPRANFSELGDTIELLKSLASYINLIDEKFFEGPTNYKEIYKEIFYNYKKGIVPENNRNLSFEERYLNRGEDFDFLYSDKGRLGRMFRHYMEYFSFFGVIKNGYSRNKKLIDRDSINELILTPEKVLFDVFRNKILNLNIKDNEFIKNISGISLKSDADYRPAKAIISYCNELKRKCTVFEVSVLLGRVDDVQNEKDILRRAILIGRQFPNDAESQKKMLFGSMGWKTPNNILFEYSQSQNPDFKFKVFLLFMKVFGLIELDEKTNLISLTDYSRELAKEDIPFEVLDLEKLLTMVDDDNEDSNKLMDIILRKRTDTITKAIQEDSELVVKLNFRNIRNPIIKNGKRQRNRFIAELAKIKCNYLDEITRTATFVGKNGKNYVEAHHIIEFSTEDGPDITDNLICLGPENHSLIHHGSAEEVEDFYLTCKSRGVLSLERFKLICTRYKCLKKEHVKILVNKKIISKFDAEELNKLIDENGINPFFLASLTTPAGR